MSSSFCLVRSRYFVDTYRERRGAISHCSWSRLDTVRICGWVTTYVDLVRLNLIAHGGSLRFHHGLLVDAAVHNLQHAGARKDSNPF